MKGMTSIVKKTTQILAGIIFLYGAYVVIHGHLTPGGGFAGGVIMAGAFILVTLAFGSGFLNLKKEETESTATENISILMVILLSLVGLFFGAKIFFLNFLPKGTVGELISAGVLPLYNIFVGMEVASSIFIIFLALVIFKEEEP
jgi:multisubunit Na+/H+ antiporter MnhB subunit